ncbi:MAG TPA: M20/M25/M40 family metallo-hydrolase [Candidatus Acidoferrales bacterium]|nr:M20/M25/M40 family metallo-hydrolase [Candidatus Acidoferrales bacterium]
MSRRVFLMLGGAFLAAGLAAPAAAQTLTQDLQKIVETPAVTGYERRLSAWLRQNLASWKPQVDGLGDVIVTIGHGSPRRLLAAPMDEPGYVVSAITPEGFLRVQRLPQLAPNPVFDELWSAEPVAIFPLAGRAVTGIVAGPSVHLQSSRPVPVHVRSPEDIYIDIGADSAAEVRRAGVDLLDPVALDRSLYQLGSGKLAGMAVGDRFGCAALVEFLRRLDPSKLQGTLVVAFAAQQWAGARGIERITDFVRPGEMVYVGAAEPGRGPSAAGAAPTREPGAGVLVAGTSPQAPLAGLPAELERLAAAHRIPLTTDYSVSPFPPGYSPAPDLPPRFAHLAVPVAWRATPAEMIDSADLAHLAELLELYFQGTSSAPVLTPLAPPALSTPERPKTPPPVPALLKDLVETYGISEREGPVREAVGRLLPPWAKTETDAAGNLILRWQPAARAAGPRLLFVAHTDEIGFAVQSIAADGRLEVVSRGGGELEYFLGHPVIVLTRSGPRPGVLELPAGWQKEGLPLRPERGAVWRVDVGARTAAQARELGVEAGDVLTIPKKYRTLLAARSSARSFDDRVGCTALIAAAWALGPNFHRDVTFVWSTGEELGLHGAAAIAGRLAAEGREPDVVFAIDTFVSSDSPLESKRFADAPIGRGFVVRAVDNSNIVPLDLADRMVRLARANAIPVQYGVTGGGNDGSAFLRYGAIDVALGWPLRYSHSPGEVIDTRDAEGLARILAAAARSWR